MLVASTSPSSSWPLLFRSLKSQTFLPGWATPLTLRALLLRVMASRLLLPVSSAGASDREWGCGHAAELLARRKVTGYWPATGVSLVTTLKVLAVLVTAVTLGSVTLLKLPVAMALLLIKRHAPPVKSAKLDRPLTTRLPARLTLVAPRIWSSVRLLPFGSRSMTRVLPASRFRLLVMVSRPGNELLPKRCPGLSVPPDCTVTAPVVLPLPARVALLLTVMAEAARLPLRVSMPPLSVVAPV